MRVSLLGAGSGRLTWQWRQSSLVVGRCDGGEVVVVGHGARCWGSQVAMVRAVVVVRLCSARSEG